MFRSLALGLAASAACVVATTSARADVPLARIVESHVLPGYTALAEDSAALAEVATTHCDAGDAELEAAYAAAFDAWIRVSHLRFGPAEVEDRAYALAFWPDSRGATPSTLSALIADEDPVVWDPSDFATVSIAARGFYALEFLLYDDHVSGFGDAGYRCRLVQAVTADIAAVSAAILADWQGGHADLFRAVGENDTYRSREEAAQEFYKALSFGLEFTAETRLGRPLGSFERPRPNRAEARRSGRSLRHVVLSLEGTRELALLLAEGHPDLRARIAAAYDNALEGAEGLDDPVLAGVADPQGRFRVEALQTDIDTIRRRVSTELGPILGVAAGFNSMDGD